MQAPLPRGVRPAPGTIVIRCSGFRGSGEDRHAIEGLWGLAIQRPLLGVDADKVYFAAGIDNEDHGLAGFLQPDLRP
jgi:hypothetical protein